MGLQNLNLTGLNQQLDLVIQQNPWILPVLFVIAIWKITWYGIALFYAAQRKQKIWFAALLACAFFLNDLGIVAIVYVFVSKRLALQLSNKNKKIAKKKAK